MEILILTGKFGMGHWSAAASLKEQLEGAGHRVRVTDLFEYAIPETAPLLYRGFDLMVTYAGGVYNLVHRMTRDTAGEVPLAGQLVRGLDRLLAQARPQLVFSTHPVCSGAVARWKAERGSPLPLVTCITDVTCHSEWLHPGTDYYLAPGEPVREGLAAKGVGRERIVVTGIPVKEAFGAGRGPRSGGRELLIMGGGLGLMPRGESFYEALDALPGVHTTILTGKNRKLYDRLRGRYENVEAVEFTDRVWEYMARADLMLSKPGGITAFEAIASRLPMLIWEPFLEQERENARFLTAQGMGRVVPRGEEGCLAALRACIYDDELLASMGQAMERVQRTLCRHALGEILLRAEGVCA